MVIVDSSVWIEAFRGTRDTRTAWLESALGREALGVTSLILCEVLQGIRSDRQFGDARRHFATLPIYDTIGSELAVQAAKSYRELRLRGITVRSTVDCLIATFCIENEFSLLHNDRDFDAFESHLGLKVLHPPAVARG